MLTNDGDFAYRMTHPKHEVSKVYEVVLNKGIEEKEIELLRGGVEIDGRRTAKCEIEVMNDRKLNITIHEGRNRQVRKMFEVIGKRVIELKRIKIGDICLGNLQIGGFRHLKLQEIEKMLDK